MSGDLVQIVDIFQKVQQARCKTKTVRVSGTITTQARQSTTTFRLESVGTDRVHYTVDTPASGGQTAGPSKFEIVAIGKDVYTKQGDQPWQAVPPERSAQFASIFSSGLTFDFSPIQGAAGVSPTPNATAVAGFQTMRLKKSAATKNGVTCDNYEITFPTSNGRISTSALCVDPSKNLPVEWDTTVPGDTGETTAVFTYEWDVPITITKPI